MSLKEIAKRAGTSVSTVSRVLNNENYKCSDAELEKRIWQAAQELRYLPNAAARALQKGGDLQVTLGNGWYKGRFGYERNEKPY